MGYSADAWDEGRALIAACSVEETRFGFEAERVILAVRGTAQTVSWGAKPLGISLTVDADKVAAFKAWLQKAGLESLLSAAEPQWLLAAYFG